MPIVSFITPDGPEEHVYDELWSDEQERVQRVTGLLPIEFDRALKNMHPSAWIALIQVLRAREGRKSSYGEIRLKLSSIDFRMTEEEEREALQNGTARTCDACEKVTPTRRKKCAHCGAKKAKPAADAEPEPQAADPN